MSVSGKNPFSFDLASRISAPSQQPAREDSLPAETGGGAGAPEVSESEGSPSQDAAAGKRPEPGQKGAKRVCMRIPLDVYDEIRALAREKGTTVTNIAVEAMRMRLARPDLFETVGESRRA